MPGGPHPGSTSSPERGKVWAHPCGHPLGRTGQGGGQGLHLLLIISLSQPHNYSLLTEAAAFVTHGKEGVRSEDTGIKSWSHFPKRPICHDQNNLPGAGWVPVSAPPGAQPGNSRTPTSPSLERLPVRLPQPSSLHSFKHPPRARFIPGLVLGCSAGQESACNAVEPGSIPGSGRPAGEGIGSPLQYFWASLVA